jgi:hypothetical protein
VNINDKKLPDTYKGYSHDKLFLANLDLYKVSAGKTEALEYKADTCYNFDYSLDPFLY